MKRLIAIILLGGILTHIFYSSGLLIDYYLNLEGYSVRCENKSLPKLNCDGQCILAQKIAAAEKKKSEKGEESTPPTPPISLQYLVSDFSLTFQRNASLSKHNGVWQTPFVKDLVYILLKPPI